jgi:tol-pal system protein YbgF
LNGFWRVLFSAKCSAKRSVGKIFDVVEWVTNMIQSRKPNAARFFMRAWPLAVVAICGVAVGAAAAMADVSTAPTARKAVLVHKLNAEEIQARALQAQLFMAQQQAGEIQQGGQQTGLIRTADLFGESDQDKAARLAREQAQDASIAQLNQRVGDLEDSLRRLTGQMELLSHKLNDVNARIDRMQKDFDYKICTMTAQQLGTTADQNGLPCGGGEAAPAPQQQSSGPSTINPNAPQQLAPPPGILGQIPSNTAMPIPPPASAAQGGNPTTSSNRPQFDAAMGKLSKGEYDEARAGFRTFADANPQDPLASQAVYWVGAIAFVQKDYPNAARAFVEEIKKYGTSPRAPDSMLKLGQSLLAMNQKPQGCTTLEALPGKYPQASPNVLIQAKEARKVARCK